MIRPYPHYLINLTSYANSYLPSIPEPPRQRHVGSAQFLHFPHSTGNHAQMAGSHMQKRVRRAIKGFVSSSFLSLRTATKHLLLLPSTVARFWDLDIDTDLYHTGLKIIHTYNAGLLPPTSTCSRRIWQGDGAAQADPSRDGMGGSPSAGRYGRPGIFSKIRLTNSFGRSASSPRTRVGTAGRGEAAR